MSPEKFDVVPKSATVHYGRTTERVAASPESVPVRTATGVGGSQPVALLVCHGMGEQVRFETIGQVAAALLKEAQAQGCSLPVTGVELAFQNDGFLARAELNWTAPDGTQHSVHVYEAYWAPITEGRVSYWDTVKFLFSAAVKGLASSRFFGACNFQRYLFGQLREMPISPRTKIALLSITFFLLAQVIAIAVVLAKLLDELKQMQTAHFAIRQVIEVLLPGIHALLPGPVSAGQRLAAIAALVGWYLLVVEVLLVRFFLIEYAGDVAAYISPYKDSKFDEIRTRIQAVGLNVAKVIYGFGNTTAVPEYERVVFAGHSLGSVLAYDTLNAAINLDLTSATPGSRRVAERTSKLITFGSPLDKTAFLFRNQTNHVKDPLREQMVTAFQPLILDYDRFRKPHFWTNLWSPLDIISGSLEYYDVHDGSVPDELLVTNLRDPAGTIPIVAHVQYWEGEVLGRVLYDAVK